MEAYHDAGADWLFPEALQSKEEFAEAGAIKGMRMQSDQEWIQYWRADNAE